MNPEKTIRDAIELQQTLMERIKDLTEQLLECHCNTHSLSVQNSLLQIAIGFNMTTQKEIDRLREIVRRQQEIIDRLQAGKEQDLSSD